MEKEKYLCLSIQSQGFESVVKNGGSKRRINYRGFYSQINHNTRKEEMDNNYLVNPNLSHLNIHRIIENVEIEVEELIEEVQENYLDFYKRKMPSNTKPFINGRIVFSPSMNEDMERFGIDKMINTIQDFLEEEYGNVISLDCHFDETTKHFHFCALNYDFEKHKTHTRILEERLKDKSNEERRNITQDNLEIYLKNNIEGFDYKRGKIDNIKQYHSKRKEQENHLTNQKIELKGLKEKVEILENENIELKEENQNLVDLNENIENEIIDIFKIYEDDINELVQELNELNEEMEIKDFYKKMKRYLKSENEKKLKALILKTNKRMNSMKKKKSSHTLYKQR